MPWSGAVPHSSSRFGNEWGKNILRNDIDENEVKIYQDPSLLASLHYSEGDGGLRCGANLCPKGRARCGGELFTLPKCCRVSRLYARMHGTPKRELPKCCGECRGVGVRSVRFDVATKHVNKSRSLRRSCQFKPPKACIAQVRLNCASRRACRVCERVTSATACKCMLLLVCTS